MTLQIETIETPSLGDRSYIVIAGPAATVIDPQRDIDRIVGIVEGAGARVTHVLETHIHNDYVTGGLELARWADAEYCVAAADDVAFARRPVRPGEVIGADGMSWRVVATPGHTPTHLSYVLERSGVAEAVFTGGSLLYGTVGRTDLISPDMTEDLTRRQYRAVRHLLDTLPAKAGVFPTHGFGSFCASTGTFDDDATPIGYAASTVAAERLANMAMATDDEDEFVTTLIAGLTDYPTYYAHMAPLNRAGPDPVDLTPPDPVDTRELLHRIEAGEWVVDLRNRTAYAAGHISGTLGFELGDSFATYLGWTMPWGSPVTLVGESPEQIAEAQRTMARIGIAAAGQATGAYSDIVAGLDESAYQVATFEDLAAAWNRRGRAVVDVRRHDEYREARVTDAINIPLPEVEDRAAELPQDELWVHCRSGYRASIACSLLDRAGFRTVLIDDHFDQARNAGVPLTAG